MKIQLNTIADVNNFCKSAMDCKSEIDVISGRYTINAKSIMGLFSLNLSDPVEVVIHDVISDDPAVIEAEKAKALEVVKPYIVE